LRNLVDSDIDLSADFEDSVVCVGDVCLNSDGLSREEIVGDNGESEDVKYSWLNGRVGKFDFHDGNSEGSTEESVNFKCKGLGS